MATVTEETRITVASGSIYGSSKVEMTLGAFATTHHITDTHAAAIGEALARDGRLSCLVSDRVHTITLI